MGHTLDYKNPPKYITYVKRSMERFPNEIMISKNEFDMICKQPCHYCGKDGPNGVDRVDNLVGYVLENCVPSCKHCNYVKGDLTQADFDIWMRRFVNKQGSCVK